LQNAASASNGEPHEPQKVAFGGGGTFALAAVFFFGSSTPTGMTSSMAACALIEDESALTVGFAFSVFLFFAAEESGATTGVPHSTQNTASSSNGEPHEPQKVAFGGGGTFAFTLDFFGAFSGSVGVATSITALAVPAVVASTTGTPQSLQNDEPSRTALPQKPQNIVPPVTEPTYFHWKIRLSHVLPNVRLPFLPVRLDSTSNSPVILFVNTLLSMA
jgi:hypothetical protein